MFAKAITICYPSFNLLGRALRTIPLSARSLLIKTCQAQYQPVANDGSPLSSLLSQHPPITICTSRDVNQSYFVGLCDILPQCEVNCQDPISSAIILDIIRSSPVDSQDRVNFINKGWITEVRLAETPGEPSCDFSSLFRGGDNPIHPSLPHNPASAYRIRRRLEVFRATMKRWRQRLYPRATHKNMSRDTRRHFEEHFQTSLEHDPIFGQDDWQRVYHETGVQIEGKVEMRQKWYPSGAKPRTYFAMGGTCYRDARHLQGFFSSLVGLFPETNNITRLRPERLRLPENNTSFLIYDLSSFTSNMVEQKAFCRELSAFFSGVEVEIVDEVHGLLIRDLGEMLEEYNITCVERPELSFERVPEELRPGIDNGQHERASMLGIFGNLMTCTLAHFFIISPLHAKDDSINIAGDDGIIPVNQEDESLVWSAIEIVGDCAPEKTMHSTDPGAYHLKRPIWQQDPFLLQGKNFVPPNLATSISYLSGENKDPRFHIFGLEDMGVEERVSVVGKDLSRFLQVCHEELKQPNPVIRYDQVIEVYQGFSRLVKHILGFRPTPQTKGRPKFYVWPVDIASYDFVANNPFLVWCIYCIPDLCVVSQRERKNVSWDDLRDGEAIGNSSPNLGLLERLGYVEKDEVTKTLGYNEAVDHFYMVLRTPRLLPPKVYQYRLIRTLPESLVFDD